MPQPSITNHDAALILLNIAAILELTDGNPYRVRAYRRAALLLLRLRVPATEFLSPEGELLLPGLGERLRRKLGELFSHGEMSFYRDLYASLPTGMVSLMRVPGIGPRIALRLMAELGLESPEDVIQAAEAGAIRKLYRFGEKSEANLARAARALIASSSEEPDLFEAA
ncbi:helix-hairpin-helix domain-containing protein [Nitrolancea hollandica]|uniref:PHP domain protein n=1 Tax=Nitrolancea hollandica Lb TaxID=1129897 RepID=I4EKM6_9BACT|nr:helix-hairpin-helix domain-containing protein [Nitrolancea hollandica]CCF85238.1 PHP domain protein [Nitrolancea hollandica Lb]